jgi:hypothetical protein
MADPSKSTVKAALTVSRPFRHGNGTPTRAKGLTLKFIA